MQRRLADWHVMCMVLVPSIIKCYTKYSLEMATTYISKKSSKDKIFLLNYDVDLFNVYYLYQSI